MTKKKDDNLKIDINAKEMKKYQCPTCNGAGKVDKGKLKCPTCGGSGSLNDVNLMTDLAIIEKGKPQVKYEVTIRDTKQDKVVYKKVGFGGALVSVEGITKFTGKEMEGSYQSALWGNPLVQRFAIDRLEESFAKNIESYLDALEEAGLYFSSRDQMKKMMIEGNTIKLLTTMQQAGNITKKDYQVTPENDASHQVCDDEKDTFSFLEKGKIAIRSGSPFAILILSHNKEKGIAANMEALVKAIPLKRVITDVIEFVAVTSLKQTNHTTDALSIKKFTLQILGDIIKNINDSLKSKI